MNKFINIYFSKIKNPSFTQRLFTVNSINVEYNSDYKKEALSEGNFFNFKYKLRDTPYCEKFIELFTRMCEYHKNDTNVKPFDYNLYESDGFSSILEKRQELNSLLNTLNLTRFKVDDSLFLDESTYQAENDKLNKLHILFEDNVNKYIMDNREDEEYRDQLERLNSLIHQCESVTLSSRVYQVFRLDLCDDIPLEELSDEEHLQKTHPSFGTVEMDLGIIGKDLQSCYRTDDVNLLKEKKLNPSYLFSPWLSTNFVTHDGEDEIRYKDWCEKNNIIQYGYDYTEPKHKMGKLVLGDWEDRYLYSTVSRVLKIKKEYPHFVDITITEEA